MEEEIYQALLVSEGIDKSEGANPMTASICKGHAKAAATVVKKYILEACREQREKCADAYYQSAVRNDNYRAATNNLITHANPPDIEQLGGK